MSKAKRESLPRRDFLKAAGVTGAAAGVAVMALSGKPAKAATAEGRKSAGYRQTDHILKYYESARL